jgi:uncharacterized protein YqhQ
MKNQRLNKKLMADNLKAGMSFPQGFGLGYKDEFYLVNERGKVKTGKMPAISKAWDIPIIRGWAILVFAAGNLIKMVPALGYLLLIILLAPLLGVLVNTVMPAQGATLLPILSEIGTIALFAAVFVEAITGFKIVKKVATAVVKTLRWHSVEHRVYAALKKNLKPTIANIAIQKKEQPECGSTLVFWIFAVAITSRALMGNILGGFDGYFAVFVVFPVVYELHRFYRGKGWTWYSAPGWLVQQFTTMEPNNKQFYVAGTKIMRRLYGRSCNGRNMG